ncbi:MAG: hypothetical protein AAFV29_19105, partial [Myxococcota bacterium]
MRRRGFASGCLWVWGLSMLAGCGEPAPITRTVLALGTAPDRVASLSVSVFGPNGSVASATVAPPLSQIDVGVPAEVPLLFQVVARTSIPAPGGFSAGMPAFVARTQRTIPLASEQIRVGLEAKPAGGLQLFIASDPEVPSGVLIIRPEVGGVGVRFNILPERGMIMAQAVLRRGRHAILYVPDEPTDRRLLVRNGNGLWVAQEQISAAQVDLGFSSPSRTLQLSLEDDQGRPLPPDGARASFNASLSLLVDRTPETFPEVDIEFTVETTGTAQLDGLPARARGLPQRWEGLRVSGEGRVVIRARALDSSIALSALGVINAGAAGALTNLVLTIEDPENLRDGTVLEVWAVDAQGRLVPLPAGTLNFADSDPWVVRQDGDVVNLEDATMFRVRHPVALPKPIAKPTARFA